MSQSNIGHFLQLLDSLEVYLARWPAATAVLQFSQDTSERLTRVVHRSVAPGASHDNFSCFEHQRRRFRFVLVDEADDLVVFVAATCVTYHYNESKRPDVYR